jgi:hypothetical protein
MVSSLAMLNCDLCRSSGFGSYGKIGVWIRQRTAQLGRSEAWGHALDAFTFDLTAPVTLSEHVS